MTAQRWWVRLVARWLARVDGVTGQLRLAMLCLTGVSTATLTLREYGHGEYAWPLIGVLAGGTLVYTYLYTEGGVWNQVSRDRMDMSDNYAAPGAYISSQIQMQAIAAALEAVENENDPQQAAHETVNELWNEYRDGANLQAIEQ